MNSLAHLLANHNPAPAQAKPLPEGVRYILAAPTLQQRIQLFHERYAKITEAATRHRPQLNTGELRTAWGILCLDHNIYGKISNPELAEYHLDQPSGRAKCTHDILKFADSRLRMKHYTLLKNACEAELLKTRDAPPDKNTAVTGTIAALNVLIAELPIIAPLLLRQLEEHLRKNPVETQTKPQEPLPDHLQHLISASEAGLLKRVGPRPPAQSRGRRHYPQNPGLNELNKLKSLAAQGKLGYFSVTTEQAMRELEVDNPDWKPGKFGDVGDLDNLTIKRMVPVPMSRVEVTCFDAPHRNFPDYPCWFEATVAVELSGRQEQHQALNEQAVAMREKLANDLRRKGYDTKATK